MLKKEKKTERKNQKVEKGEYSLKKKKMDLNVLSSWKDDSDSLLHHRRMYTIKLTFVKFVYVYTEWPRQETTGSQLPLL